ncbi:YoaK family protein [Sphingomonas sp. PR090111-T3T-6A]|uniref:YoaK family protein n=1 Tax=Sphingomonas sp. PR090111-T3T-6A TaxID=685778 RepID=UPI00068766B0|nr:YoaK family protein [Sphingomonas sp. PR090111-T3T-6A]
MTSGQGPHAKAIVFLLLVLSATTGLVDAASVLGLGKVFTANMTGNIVFLGFALAGTPGFSWPLYVVALLFFMGGAGAGGRICKVQAPLGRRRWLLWAGTIEAILFGLAAACALASGRSPAEIVVMAMIALTAAAMGFRNATVRQLKVADLTTTVLTLTITGLAADSTVASGGGNPNLGRRFGAVLAILLGALAGALLVLHTGLALPLALAGLITFVATVALANDLPAQG